MHHHIGEPIIGYRSPDDWARRRYWQPNFDTARAADLAARTDPAAE